MSKKGLSRRDLLKVTGGLGAGALVGAKPFGVPAFIRRAGEPDFTDPAAVRKALTAEGATVQMSSWGFGGLSASVLPNQFSEYTKIVRCTCYPELDWQWGHSEQHDDTTAGR